MKRIFCSVILVFFFAGAVCFTGCNSGSGDILRGMGLVFAIAILASTGGAGAPVAFAASNRDNTKAKICFSSQVTKSKVKVKVTPRKSDGTTAQETVVNASTLNVNEQNQIEGNLNVSVPDPSFTEFKIEIVYSENQGSKDAVLIESYFQHDPTINTTQQVVDPQTTAKSMIYDNWKENSSNKSLSDFEAVFNSSTDYLSRIQTLSDDITSSIARAAEAGQLSTYSPLNDDIIKAKAQEIAKEIPAEIPASSTATKTATLTATSTSTVFNPYYEALPLEKTTVATLTYLENQIGKIIESSLSPALSGVPVSYSKRASVADTGLPEIIPVAGGNSAIDINGLTNRLMNAVSGNSAVTGPSFLNLEDTSYEVSFSGNTYIVTRNVCGKTLAKTTMTGVAIEGNGNNIKQFVLSDGSVILIEDYNSDGTAVISKTTMKLLTGLKIQGRHDRIEESGFLPGVRPVNDYDTFSPSVRGYKYVARATDVIDISVSSPVILEVTHQKDSFVDQGTLSISGVTGSTSLTNHLYIGNMGYDDTSLIRPYKMAYIVGTDKESRDFTFGKSVEFTLRARVPSYDLYLNDMTIIMPNVSKGINAKNEEVYSFSGGTCNLSADYTGKNFKDYGYIKNLQITIGAFSYDGNNDKVADGAVARIIKTNSDNTVDRVNYEILNGKISVAGDAINSPGSEITVGTFAGNAEFKGKVAYSDKAGNKMTIDYIARLCYPMDYSRTVTVTADYNVECLSSLSALRSRLHAEPLTQSLIKEVLSHYTFSGTGISSIDEANALMNFLHPTSTSHRIASAVSGIFKSGMELTIWDDSYGKKDRYSLRFGNSDGSYWGSNATFFELLAANSNKANVSRKVEFIYASNPATSTAVVCASTLVADCGKNIVGKIYENGSEINSFYYLNGKGYIEALSGMSYYLVGYFNWNR
ncbi:MAG: hypothetical protein HQM10_10200 [Candidatus Riflebacteria bacterium]|nr:hypothetical protein [Candidatus Riflebacteria bacterium]